MFLLVSLLAIGAGVSATAPQASPTEQQLRQQIEAVVMQWRDALNSGNGPATAAFYAPDAIGIDAYGKHTGSEFEVFAEELHKRGLKLAVTVEDVRPLFGGQGAVAAGTFKSTYEEPTTPAGEGNFIQVFERQGNAWKIRAQATSRVVIAMPPK